MAHTEIQCASVQGRVYRRAAKRASGLSVDTIESIDEKVVVKIKIFC
jgi:hypothetical protein